MESNQISTKANIHMYNFYVTKAQFKTKNGKKSWWLPGGLTEIGGQFLSSQKQEKSPKTVAWFWQFGARFWAWPCPKLNKWQTCKKHITITKLSSLGGFLWLIGFFSSSYISWMFTKIAYSKASLMQFDD